MAFHLKPVKQPVKGSQPGGTPFAVLHQGIGGGHHAAEVLVARIGQIIRKAEYPEAVAEKRSDTVRQFRQARKNGGSKDDGCFLPPGQ